MSRSSDQGADSVASERLYELDRIMQRNYDIARDAHTARMSPTIHAQFDEKGGTYHLRWKGRTRSVQPVPDLYQKLKSVSHTTVGLFVILAPRIDHPEDTTWVGPLTEWRDHLALALGGLDRTGMPEESAGRCRNILEQGIGFCDRALERRSFTVEEYAEYGRRVVEDVTANVGQAAGIQVDATVALAEEWREMLGDEWEQTFVIVTTAWAMRRENVHLQVWEHVMGTDQLNWRLILAEGFNDTATAWDTLGQIDMDRTVAELVFADRYRLEVELMGDDAAAAVERHACPTFPSIMKPHKPHKLHEVT